MLGPKEAADELDGLHREAGRDQETNGHEDGERLAGALYLGIMDDDAGSTSCPPKDGLEQDGSS